MYAILYLNLSLRLVLAYFLPLPRKGGILLDLIDHIENTEHHHPRVMGCDALTPKDIRLSNIHQTSELRLLMGQGIPPILTIYVAHQI